MTALEVRRGDWMQTFTGRAFWPLDPRPEDIDPADIAHALSLLCRYGGHVERFYSVAEHCVHMSHAVEPEHALAALLHDAAEAYLVDLLRPVKRHLPNYSLIEDDLLDTIARKYGLHDGPEPSGRDEWYVIPAAVKYADNRILLDERAALLAAPPRPWHQDIERLQPLGVDIVGWSPRRAEWMYLERLAELGVLS